MLEAVAAGTTTVVDHAHVTCSPDHAKLAIAATASSGIRSVFCYTPAMRVKQFNPLTYHSNAFEDWVMQTFDDLADRGPFGEDRVKLGFRFRPFLPSTADDQGTLCASQEQGRQNYHLPWFGQPGQRREEPQ